MTRALPTPSGRAARNCVFRDRPMRLADGGDVYQNVGHYRIFLVITRSISILESSRNRSLNVAHRFGDSFPAIGLL